MSECRRCGKETERKAPHCTRCVKELRADGLCCWCGVEPRNKKAGRRWSGYCVKCGQNSALALIQKAKERRPY